MRYLPYIRCTVQLSALLIFCALPFIAALGIASVRGTLFGLDFFGIPFADPVSALQTTVQTGVNGYWPLTALFIGAGLSLLLALVFGRVFCGWICPYGFLTGLLPRWKKNRRFRKVSRHIFIIKIIIFVTVLALGTFLGLPLLVWLSLPGQISLAPHFISNDPWLSASLLLAPFMALLLDAIVGERFFCSSFCPQSVLLGLASNALPRFMPGLRINWKKEKCNCKERTCVKACPFFLVPQKTESRRDCLMCGDCIAACAHRTSALHWSFFPPANQNKQTSTE